MSIYDHASAYGPLCGALQPWYGTPHQYACDFRMTEDEKESGVCYDAAVPV